MGRGASRPSGVLPSPERPSGVSSRLSRELLVGQPIGGGMPGGPDDSVERVRTAEVIAATCLATDLGMGFPFEHGLHTTLMAMRLADLLSVSPETASQTYYASLLTYSGCTTDADLATEVFGGSALDNLTPRQFGSGAAALRRSSEIHVPSGHFGVPPALRGGEAAPAGIPVQGPPFRGDVRGGGDAGGAARGAAVGPSAVFQAHRALGRQERAPPGKGRRGPSADTYHPCRRGRRLPTGHRRRRARRRDHPQPGGPRLRSGRCRRFHAACR